MLKKDIEEIKKYRKLFPKYIRVLVVPLESGGYGAEIFGFEGKVRTEAKTFSELIFMVNDVVRCVLKVPEKYFGDMVEYSPPIEVAQKFNVFPKLKKELTIKLFSEGTVV